MKKTLLLLIFTSLFLSNWAQKEILKVDKEELKNAKIQLATGDYIGAFEMYSALFTKYPENSEVLYGLGVCRLNRRGQEKDALSFLIRAYQEGDENLDVLFYLGQAYIVNHRLEEAINSFEDYKTLKKRGISLGVVNKYLDMALNAQKYISNPRNVELINLGESINTENQESVPVMLPGSKGVFFTSRREGGFNSEKDYLGDYMQDIYYSEYKDKKWQTPINVKSLNTELHDASVSISHNGSTFISYRTNENIIGGDLYFSLYKDSVWSEPQKFGKNINSQYQEPSASLSPDEYTLYFSSNRPDGYGGLDLYKVQKLPNGKWGKPINLGPNINTAFNEDAPFIHADGKTLYFSSDGHSSMGGFDIFKSTKKSNSVWSTPENLGYPINTVDHDIYFTLSPDNRTAYYSSERASGFGKQDLYQIRMLDSEDYKTVVKCNIYDQETKKPVNAIITLVDEQSHKLNGVYQSNARTGYFIMIILPEVQYQLVIEAEGYTSKILHTSFPEGEAPDMDHDFKLDKALVEKEED